MKKLLLIIFLSPIFVLAQSTNQNYIKTTIYKDDSSTPVKSVSVDYYDGLGRPLQHVANQQSSSGKDIVVPIVYDALGRQPKEYLPYVAQTTTMPFTDNATVISSLTADYTTKYGTDGQTPYAEKIFEPTPLNRVVEQGAPGADWQVIPNSSAGHTIKYEYGLNSGTTTAEKVKLFKATATWNATYEYFSATLVNAAGTTYYPVDKLVKTVLKDENWTSGKSNTTEEYKNIEGQILLKRTFNGSTAYNTYYVYDQFGNVSFIIPPGAPSNITSTVLANLCYQYRYDNKNRVVEKKLPGKQWEFIVYDKLDRAVATGPTLSPFGTGGTGWLITKYDVFGRVVLTGWVSAGSMTSTTRKTLQASTLNVQTVFNETKSTADTTMNGVAFRYTTVAYPTSGYHVLNVFYYDDYNFTNAPAAFTTVEGETVFYNNSTLKPKSLPTGSWTRAVETSTAYRGELSFNLYDKKSRPIRIRNINYLGGYSQKDIKYDFLGKTLYMITTHKRTTGAETYLMDSFTYTPQDRLLTHMHKIGTSGTFQLMSRNEYDELGNLKTKKVGGTDVTAATYFQKVDYAYNIRGWMKSINDISNLSEGGGIPQDLFAFKINYNEFAGTVPNVKKLYNGNISETYWRSASDNVQRKYGYAYDNLNRLVKSVYQKPGSSSVVRNSYNETIGYDMNGNITDIQRTGGIDSDSFTIGIDDLKYEYAANSNQLMKVYDLANSTQGFADDSDGTNDIKDDYAYDLNGNLVSDENKLISAINYNHLNLPVKIIFSIPGTNTIEYIYNAAGQKLQKKVSMTVSGITTVTTTDYLSGFQYADTVLQSFSTSEGYIRVKEGIYNYVFNYTDHLGNIRVSYAQDPANPSLLKIIEENHYYPYGLKHENYNIEKYEYLPAPGGMVLASVSALQYKYKYNGLEYQDELAFNVFDMNYRDYDPAIGRWLGMDPVDHFTQSPYNGYDSNPVFWADPSGANVIVNDAGIIATGADAGSFFTALLGAMNGGDFVWTITGTIDASEYTGPVYESFVDLGNGGGGGGSGASPGPSGLVKFSNLSRAQLNYFSVIGENGGLTTPENGIKYATDGFFTQNFSDAKAWFKIGNGNLVTVTVTGSSYNFSVTTYSWFGYLSSVGWMSSSDAAPPVSNPFKK